MREALAWRATSGPQRDYLRKRGEITSARTGLRSHAAIFARLTARLRLDTTVERASLLL
jgi:hypothetical protein